jgi:CRP-like cAMP-binding protein
MTLPDYLKHTIGLPDNTIDLLDKLFTTERLPKGHVLLKEGSKSKRFFYVEKGLARLYYLKEEKDITQNFLQECAIYLSVENVFLNQRHPYNLVLLEDSVIRSVDFSLLETYIDADINLQRLSRFLTASIIKQLAVHLHDIQFQTAQDRYHILLSTYPDILLRAPLGHIASYLGITQQTLSVIRAQRGG